MLHLVYQSNASDPDPESFMPRAKVLLDRLLKMGITKPLHVDDGEYTWYKMNEWMQVEILQAFGNSLETSPWYRFPFVDFMRNYFQVLAKEAGIVSKFHGTKKAFCGLGFITSLVPGIIMSYLFAQVQLLALPLKALPESTGFGSGYDAAKTIEHLVVTVPHSAEARWSEVDNRIKATCVHRGLYTLTVPTFKPLTDIIVHIAVAVPAARILEISNQSRVQVKVFCRDFDRQVKFLRTVPGCEVMFNFSYPVDGTALEAGTTASLCVLVPYLLSTIRACQKAGVEVQQIYDFYC